MKPGKYERKNKLTEQEKKQRNTISQQKWRIKNKEKRAEYTSAWRKTHLGRMKELYKRSKEKEFEKFLGSGAIKHFEIQQLLQNNSCAICKEEFDQTPCRDHDHFNGQWRGMLCSRCNLSLGNFDIERLQAAILYLQKWRSNAGNKKV